MNLIEQLQSDVARHQRQLEERLVELAAEQVETRKVLRSVKSYQAKLLKQHPNGEAMLPLAEPDEEPLIPDEWHPDYDVPEEPAEESAPPPSDHEPTVEEYQAQRMSQEPAPVEPARPRRRKATAEE